MHLCTGAAWYGPCVMICWLLCPVQTTSYSHQFTTQHLVFISESWLIFMIVHPRVIFVHAYTDTSACIHTHACVHTSSGTVTIDWTTNLEAMQASLWIDRLLDSPCIRSKHVHFWLPKVPQGKHNTATSCTAVPAVSCHSYILQLSFHFACIHNLSCQLQLLFMRPGSETGSRSMRMKGLL